MKKLLLTLALFIAVCGTTDAHAASLTRHDFYNAISGTMFEYTYTLKTQFGNARRMNRQGNKFLSIFLNVPGINNGNLFYTFKKPTFGKGSFELNYAAISATPLPAALPLFGCALAGLGFYRRRKKVAA